MMKGVIALACMGSCGPVWSRMKPARLESLEDLTYENLVRLMNPQSSYYGAQMDYYGVDTERKEAVEPNFGLVVDEVGDTLLVFEEDFVVGSFNGDFVFGSFDNLTLVNGASGVDEPVFKEMEGLASPRLGSNRSGVMSPYVNDETVIDLMCAFNSEVIKTIEGKSRMPLVCEYAAQTTTLALHTSGLPDMRVRNVGSLELNCSEDQECSMNAGDDTLPNIKSLMTPYRKKVGADVGIFFIMNGGDRGRSYVNGFGSCISFAYGHTIRHELGHNFGLQHCPDADLYPDLNTGYKQPQTGLGTIMCGDQLPVYSNPDVNMMGYPTGDKDKANSYTMLSENLPNVAKWMASQVVDPAATNVTQVATGQVRVANDTLNFWEETSTFYSEKICNAWQLLTLQYSKDLITYVQIGRPPTKSDYFLKINNDLDFVEKKNNDTGEFYVTITSASEDYVGEQWSWYMYGVNCTQFDPEDDSTTGFIDAETELLDTTEGDTTITADETTDNTTSGNAESTTEVDTRTFTGSTETMEISETDNTTGIPPSETSDTEQATSTDEATETRAADESTILQETTEAEPVVSGTDEASRTDEVKTTEVTTDAAETVTDEEATAENTTSGVTASEGTSEAAETSGADEAATTDITTVGATETNRSAETTDTETTAAEGDTGIDDDGMTTEGTTGATGATDDTDAATKTACGSTEEALTSGGTTYETAEASGSEKAAETSSTEDGTTDEAAETSGTETNGTGEDTKTGDTTMEEGVSGSTTLPECGPTTTLPVCVEDWMPERHYQPCSRVRYNGSVWENVLEATAGSVAPGQDDAWYPEGTILQCHNGVWTPLLFEVQVVLQ